ncbi:MAG: heme ABC exporter ATP-binding protein CcmA [Steroidobacteraceae bacterium]
MLTVVDLHVFRGGRHVLRGIDLALDAGGCLQLTGPNGAGKTTLLRAVAGLCEIERGRVQWRGLDTRRDARPFHDECSYLGHEVPMKGDLTARENLRFSVGLRRQVGGEAQRAVLDRVGAAPFADQLLRSLSAGQHRRVALAALLLCATPLWLLDEPTTNLDAAGQRVLMELMDEHLGAGGLILAAVHHELELPGRRIDRLELRGAT